MANGIIRQFKRAAGLDRNVKLLLVMVAINGLGSGIMWLFLNLYILARGNDKAFLGLFTSLISIAALVLGVPMGILADRIGRKRSMLIGSLSSAAAVGILLFSPSEWLLLAAAVGFGTGQALFMATMPALIAANTAAEERATAFSLQNGLRMLIGAASSAIAGPVPAWFASMLQVGPESATAYRATLAVAWGIMWLSLIPLSMLREPPRTDQGAESQEDFSLLSTFRSLLRSQVLRLVLPQFVIALGAGLLIPYLNVFLKERFAIADSILGWSFAVYQLLIGLGTLAAPVLAERWGEVRTIVATQLISLPFLLTLGFVPILSVAIGALWVRAMLMNMGNPLYTTFAMGQTREEERGTIGAMLGTAWSLGQMFGPGVSGVVQQTVGFTPLFLATGATYLLASLLMQVFFRGLGRRPATQARLIHTK